MRSQQFKPGDPVAYLVWRFDWTAEVWQVVQREANVIRDRGREGVRLITEHDGGKRFTLPRRKVVPR